jgi:hypothetical protein
VSPFDELVASRRSWIDEVLKPWCCRAPVADLKRAELEWSDLAGRIDAQATLWTWAWGRFPELVDEQLPGVNETYEVRVTLKNGGEHVGFPDNRQSTAGRLVLATRGGEAGPWPIDQIAEVKRIHEPEKR